MGPRGLLRVEDDYESDYHQRATATTTEKENVDNENETEEFRHSLLVQEDMQV
jgi:hypothetical protein